MRVGNREVSRLVKVLASSRRFRTGENNSAVSFTTGTEKENTTPIVTHNNVIIVVLLNGVIWEYCT